MKNSKTNLILITSIILLMLFSSIFVYLLNVIKNKNNHISAISITLGKKMAEKKNLGVLEKKMTELIDTQKKISSYFVDTSNIDKFVEYLENIGTSNRSEISVNSVDVVKNDKTKMSVNLSVKGSFSQVTKTVAILENSPYTIVIHSFYLNKDINASSSVAVAESTTDKNNKEIAIIKSPSWQADISFSVLNL